MEKSREEEKRGSKIRRKKREISREEKRKVRWKEKEEGNKL
jgi:hypothetical protein